MNWDILESNEVEIRESPRSIRWRRMMMGSAMLGIVAMVPSVSWVSSWIHGGMDSALGGPPWISFVVCGFVAILVSFYSRNQWWSEMMRLRIGPDYASLRMQGKHEKRLQLDGNARFAVKWRDGAARDVWVWSDTSADKIICWNFEGTDVRKALLSAGVTERAWEERPSIFGGPSVWVWMGSVVAAGIVGAVLLYRLGVDNLAFLWVLLCIGAFQAILAWGARSWTPNKHLARSWIPWTAAVLFAATGFMWLNGMSLFS